MDVHFYHDSRKQAYRSIFGAAPTGCTVVLRLDATGLAQDATAVVRLWINGQGEALYAMTYDGTAFTAPVPMPQTGCLVWYYFIIKDGEETFYYGNNAGQTGGVGAVYEDAPPSYQITVYEKDATTPDWFKHAIVYQIFPDRFYRGKDTSAVLTGKHGAVIHSDWNDPPAYWKDEVTHDILYYDFYGGNLAGIKEKFAYLKSLGVTVIYLNPIFESLTNHRYSTADYYKVDSFLGTNEEFKAFCQAAKDEGIRIILDGVFSHTGADSIYFNKFGNYDSVGAFQSKESPYYEWYRFKDYPNDYESWWGVMDLPNVEETTPSYMDFIIYNDNSVLKYWLNEGISGWRLDVIDELPTKFLQAFYKTLKETNPDALLIGEVWEDASNKSSYGEQRQYLCGHDIDSAMNYALRAVLLDFVLCHTDGEVMSDRLLQLIEHYPKENWYAMLNLVGSHDIVRILTVLQDGVDEETALERLKLLSALQMTMPGAPCIYYGDEVGMTGGKDPDNRRTYPWGRENEDLLAWTRQIAMLRRGADALQTGRFIPLYAKDKLFAFARTIEGGKDVFGKTATDGFYIVAINVDTEKAHDLDMYTDGLTYGTLTNVLDQTALPVEAINGRIALTLPPLGVVVLKGEESAAKRAGILLHPTSLSSPYGNGELGTEAFHFIDYLKTAGQSVWQILPLTPPLIGDSPYLSSSAFAGNERLISIDVLADWGWITPDTLADYHEKAKKLTTWNDQYALKKDVLWAMSHDPKLRIDWTDYRAFCQENAYWLEDYALFKAVRKFFHDAPWTDWPEDIRTHSEASITKYKKELSSTIAHYQFVQYIFYRQWQAVRDYAHKNGVTILGDMPMFVAHNSADCWAHQDLYQFDDFGNPMAVAGVPPDYFAKDGQLWGNPLYDFKAMAKDGYQWWIERFRHLMQTVDEIRTDHFRGFEAYWSVPADAKTAKEGHWVKGPGEDLFAAVTKSLGKVPLVAEDLGVITDEVCALKAALQLPGMKVMQFHMVERADGQYSFDTEPHCLAYTGTHDNNTFRGWYEEDADDVTKRALRQTLGLDEEATSEDVVNAAIVYLYSRRAGTVIIPMQDVLHLPSSGRMNVPGVADGNWHWQLAPGMLTFDSAKWLSALCRTSSR